MKICKTLFNFVQNIFYINNYKPIETSAILGSYKQACF
jgi:hypothetical protein